MGEREMDLTGGLSPDHVLSLANHEPGDARKPVFPDARFSMTHRDVGAVVSSAAVPGNRILPTQKPHPPVLVGGNSKHAMRRAVEVGDTWYPFFVPKRCHAQHARQKSPASGNRASRAQAQASRPARLVNGATNPALLQGSDREAGLSRSDA